ncbi:MAG TPA: fumarylacetoacetate hydrolase family protein [Microvirga sp.]|jgi:2-keto-4-pentenoate hydratase|nr:fumarylacetoacetate hydrolase family protein [Microvirga sp.]
MTADASRISRLAALLLDARAEGRTVAAVPDDLVPADEAEAYRVQTLTASRLGRIAGWKVGARAPGAPPTCAPLLDSLLGPPASGRGLFRIEAELVFRLARPLPPVGRAYERREVVAALAEVLTGIEVVDSRYAAWPDVDPRLGIADHLSHGCMVLGSGTRVQDGSYAEPHVSLSVDGRTILDRVGGNTAGDPIDLVVWLANRLAAEEGGLREGDLVTTGSFTGMTEIEPGATARARFAGIGEVSVTRP